MLWYDGLGCDMSIPQYEKYMIAEHIITMTAIVVNAFAAYCVITRSPVYMGKFKYCLLYHLFATALVDFLISAALVPILVLPFMAGYVLGFLKFLPINLLAFIAFFACGLMATTSVMLFAYRHYSILPSFHSHQLSRKGKIIGFILLHSGTLLWVPFVITEKSSEEFKEYLEEKFKNNSMCPLPELLMPETYVVSIHSYSIAVFLTVYLTIACLLCIYWMSHSYYYLNTAKISKRHSTLQKKYFLAVAIQVVTPLFALIIPVGLLIGMTFRMVHGSDWINTCLAIISTHGMIGSTCLILVNPSYRRALWRPRGIASSVLITNGCRTENLPLDNETSINLKVCCCSTDMCNLNMPNPTTDKPNPTTTKLSPATQFGTLLNLIISVAAYLIYQILQK